MMRGMMAAAGVAVVVCLTGAPGVRGELRAAQDTKVTAAPAAPVNLNAATVAELQKLPGIGPAMAARIVDYRQKSGGFKKVEELMNIQGIGETSFLKLRPLVSVAAAKVAEK
jgi:competence protein ComEA